MNARLESECMSDYLFMLENHLSTDQNRVVAEVQAAASVANFNLFLTGGAMRDMLGGVLSHVGQPDTKDPDGESRREGAIAG